MIGYFIFLYITSVYPVCTDDINIDSKGLFYCISPWSLEAGSIYLYTNPYLAWGPRNTKNPRTSYWDEKYCDSEDWQTYCQFWNRAKDKHFYGGANIVAGVVPIKPLTLFVGAHGYGNWIYRADDQFYRVDTRLVSFTQLTTGLKIGFPTKIGDQAEISFGLFAWIAMWPTFLMNVGFVDAGDVNTLSREDEFRHTYKNDMETGIRILTGLRTPIGNSFINIGILSISSTEDTNRIFNSFGGGQEFDIWKRVHPAIEIAYQDSFLSLIPQVKFFIPFLDINVGLCYSLKEKLDWTPDYGIDRIPRIMVSLNPKLKIKIPVKPKPNIIIAGTVLDTIENKPIPATLTWIGPANGKKSFPAGKFSLRFLHPGAYRIGFESDGYMWKELVYRTMAYDTIEENIYMKRVIDWSVSGKVLDRKTKKGIPAQVILSGKKVAETYTDPITGEYKLFTPATGDYELIIKAKDYITQKIKIKIDNKTTIIKDVILTPTTMKGAPTKEEGTTRRRATRRR